MSACSWDHPGADAYSGTPRAAIMAMAEISRPVRLVLAERAERRDFDDAVLIDRDSIRSAQHDYTDLRTMAFGSRGKVCATVTRNWPANQVEAGWIYCQGGYCVIEPAPCHNWSIVTRIDRPAPIATYVPLPDAPAWPPAAGPIGDAPGVGWVGPLAAPAAGEFGAYPAWFGGAGGYGGGYLIERCDCCGVAVAAAVPEPMTAVLLLVGLAAVAVWGKKA